MSIARESWSAFERDISRLLMYDGFDNPRVVGQTNDHGADVIAFKNGKRWLFQAKHWKKPVGESVIDETLSAAKVYHADIPVIVSSEGFDSKAYERHAALLNQGIPLQLWDSDFLVKKAQRLSQRPYVSGKKPRDYQKDAIDAVVGAYYENGNNKALVVMATGLGKTLVAAESIRRIKANNPRLRVLVCAHTNDLVYQLERSFWPFMQPTETTTVLNSFEPTPSEPLDHYDYVFACADSAASYLDSCQDLPNFDILLVDECHHVGSATYDCVFDALNAGYPGGAFALGLTATPWRADEVDLSKYFGEPRVNIDMVKGLKMGFLANVDYRMYTDNINWDALSDLNGKSFTPRQINRTLFINQWDDAVVETLAKAWSEQRNPRAIVFCGTIDHAITMRDKINQLGFCHAEAVFSGGGSIASEKMSQFKRNQVLSDFAGGTTSVVCAVDIFNEGIDVPDVNILVFQRVTHSRRIFIQQLGRGLRVSDDKDKVIVLDFVSDIRRFAAGLDLKDELDAPEDGPVRIDLPNKVTFMKVGGEDKQAESFLREWLQDV
ncbi:MAG: DEAD/DEAH box helicase family protein, partial [Coriobacteriales bacterium]